MIFFSRLFLQNMRFQFLYVFLFFLFWNSGQSSSVGLFLAFLFQRRSTQKMESEFQSKLNQMKDACPSRTRSKAIVATSANSGICSDAAVGCITRFNEMQICQQRAQQDDQKTENGLAVITDPYEDARQPWLFEEQMAIDAAQNADIHLEYRLSHGICELFALNGSEDTTHRPRFKVREKFLRANPILFRHAHRALLNMLPDEFEDDTKCQDMKEAQEKLAAQKNQNQEYNQDTDDQKVADRNGNNGFVQAPAAQLGLSHLSHAAMQQLKKHVIAAQTQCIKGTAVMVHAQVDHQRLGIDRPLRSVTEVQHIHDEIEFKSQKDLQDLRQIARGASSRRGAGVKRPSSAKSGAQPKRKKRKAS
jgi:hypothetical protein